MYSYRRAAQGLTKGGVQPAQDGQVCTVHHRLSHDDRAALRRMAAEAARAAAARLSSKLFSAPDTSFSGCSGLGFSSGPSEPGPPAASALADSFLASLEPPKQRHSGFDVRPPDPLAR